MQLQKLGLIDSIEFKKITEGCNEISSNTWFKKVIVEDRKTNCIIKYENLPDLEQIYSKWATLIKKNKSTIIYSRIIGYQSSKRSNLI